MLAQDPFDGYTLFTPLTEGPNLGGGENYTRLIDNNEQIINQWDHDVCAATAPYLLKDGSLLCPFKIENPYMVGSAYGGKIIKYGWHGGILWEYNYSDTNYIQHHDIEPMDNGNILLISWDRKTYLEALAVGRENLNGEMWPDKVVELHPIGFDSASVVWEWHLWDHLIQDVDSTLSNFGIVEDHPELLDVNLAQLDHLGSGDWTHFNSIDYNEGLDQIILSSRNMSEFYIIDHSTTTLQASGHSGGNSNMGGDILYRWGNPMNYGRGTEEDKMIVGQHDVNWISQEYSGEGDIILYNNGALYGMDMGWQSSVMQISPPIIYVDSLETAYEIDDDAFGPNESSWIYENDFFSHIQSGARRLSNGNTLVTVAMEMRIFEVTANDEIVWDYTHIEEGQTTISKASKYSLDYLLSGELLFGDINYDYNLDIFDAILIVNSILDTCELSLGQSYVADLNLDGNISVDDIILLLGLILD